MDDIYFDVSKPLKTVFHSILVCKVKHHSLDGWMDDYMGEKLGSHGSSV